MKLREVSLVAHPAYEGAYVAGVRAEFTDEELERFIALATDLVTRRTEAAAGTSDVEPTETPDEPEAGHSARTRTRAQRIALLTIQGINK